MALAPAKRRWILVRSAVFLLAIAGCAVFYASDVRSAEVRKNGSGYNFIVILTDDQHVATLPGMPIVQARLVPRSVVFDQALVTIPECCPFRASFLSGGYYPASTGVKTNSPLNGAMKHFNDKRTLATLLQKIGYQTGFVGKYMHGYYPGYVPPGWTFFVANNEGGQLHDWMNLKDITLGSRTDVVQKVGIVPKVTEYVTYLQRDQALKFIDLFHEKPFFLYLSLYAPHVPATPAPGDNGPVADIPLDIPIERDLSDKPLWVRNLSKISGVGKQSNELIAKHRAAKIEEQLRALRPVDEAVGQILDRLNEYGILDRTLIVFTSDNGVAIGEHLLPPDKGMPYENALRVPLVIAMPGIEAHTDHHLVAVNLDVPATILDLAGIEGVGEGLSLVPLLQSREPPWREDILIEDYGYLTWHGLSPIPLWSGLRSARWKYVEHQTGEVELYDLEADPHELNNLHNDPKYRDVQTRLARRLAPMKGLAITSLEPPEALVNEPYAFRLAAWGGVPPYTWTIVRGDFPEGLSYDKASQTIAGTPRKVEERDVIIRVTDSKIASHSGKVQEFSWPLKFVVKASGS